MIDVLFLTQDKEFITLLKNIILQNELPLDIVSTDDIMKSISQLSTYNYNLIICDELFISNKNLLDLLIFLKKIRPEFQIILVNDDKIISDLDIIKKLQIYDIVNSDISSIRLEVFLSRVLEFISLKIKHRDYIIANDIDITVGNSAIARDLRQKIKSLSQINNHLLITGKEGSCKTQLAYKIYENIPNNKYMNFCVFNPVGKTEDQMLNELFGTEKKLGLIERTSSNLLVLQEIRGIPLSIQKHLQEFLSSEQQYKCNGRLYKNNTRVVCTSILSHQDLLQCDKISNDFLSLISANIFNLLELKLRVKDIKYIIRNYLDKLHSIKSISVRNISDSTLSALQMFEWEGNFREMKTLIDNLIFYAEQEKKEIIEINTIPLQKFINIPVYCNPFINYDIISQDLREARNCFEKQYLIAQLQRFGGSVSHTASFINMERTALHRKCINLGIDIDNIRNKLKISNDKEH